MSRYDDIANRYRPIRGASITVGDKGRGARYEIVGGRELDFNQRSKIVPHLNYHLSQVNDSRISVLNGRVVEVRVVEIFDSGVSVSSGRGYFYQDKKANGWFNCWSKSFREDFPRNSTVEDMAFSIAIAWTAAAAIRWRVEIRLAPNLPSISLFTDPTGIRELFRFRDIPEGHSRRTSLRNWVSQHWRQDRNDEESEIYVREHLRGHESFHWHGMDVAIHIPPPDIERAGRAVVERKRLKAAGLARRLKESRQPKERNR